MAPFAPQPDPFARGAGRFAVSLTSQRTSLPRSGLGGSPSAQAMPNEPRWTLLVGPFASLPPYSHRRSPLRPPVAPACGVMSGRSGDHAPSLPWELSLVFNVVATGPSAFRPPTMSRPSGVIAEAVSARASGRANSLAVDHSPSWPVWLSGLSTKTVVVGAPEASRPPIR